LKKKNEIIEQNAPISNPCLRKNLISRKSACTQFYRLLRF